MDKAVGQEVGASGKDFEIISISSHAPHRTPPMFRLAALRQSGRRQSINNDVCFSLDCVEKLENRETPKISKM